MASESGAADGDARREHDVEMSRIGPVTASGSARSKAAVRSSARCASDTPGTRAKRATGVSRSSVPRRRSTWPTSRWRAHGVPPHPYGEDRLHETLISPSVDERQLAGEGAVRGQESGYRVRLTGAPTGRSHEGDARDPHDGAGRPDRPISPPTARASATVSEETRSRAGRQRRSPRRHGLRLPAEAFARRTFGVQTPSSSS